MGSYEEQPAIQGHGTGTSFRLLLNPTGGNVGIGTNSPMSRLHVAGDGMFTGGDLSVWFGNKAVTLRQDGNSSYLSNKADFVGNGAESNGLLVINGEGGIALKYGSASSSGTDALIVDTSGNVGIGTTTPSSPLHVESDAFSSIFAKNTATAGATFGGFFQSASTSGRGVFGEATAAGTLPTYGVFGRSWSTSGRGVFGQANANTGINYGVFGASQSSDGYGVFSSGDYGGTGAKYFIQPHPKDPSKEIRFVCLEGNESGTYFRGSTSLVDGRAYIDVPEEFRLVSEADGLTVQVTPMGPDAGLWVESKDLNQIVVVGKGNVEFDYFVNGIRLGYADLELIRENHAYVPETRGVPYGTQYRPGHRQILVENGILNPDFTPNEETAARMGWPLKEPQADEPPK